jgi:hypothetical protein
MPSPSAAGGGTGTPPPPPSLARLVVLTLCHIAGLARITKLGYIIVFFISASMNHQAISVLNGQCSRRVWTVHSSLKHVHSVERSGAPSLSGVHAIHNNHKQFLT